MIILGLGSNIGDRVENLSAAVHMLSVFVQDMRCSRIVESPALQPPGAPPEDNLPFLNMVVGGTTMLGAREVFIEVKAIEKAVGRIERYSWGPREIDIDILAMDDLIVSEADLKIPHCGILERNFVLLPLAEVAPQWCYPLEGAYYQKLPAEIIAEKGYRLGENIRATELKLHV